MKYSMSIQVGLKSANTPVAVYFALGVAFVLLSPESVKSLFQLSGLVPAIEAFAGASALPDETRSFFSFMWTLFPLFLVWLSLVGQSRLESLKTNLPSLVICTVILALLIAPALLYMGLIDPPIASGRPSPAIARLFHRMVNGELSLAILGSAWMGMVLMVTWFSWVAIPIAWVRK